MTSLSKTLADYIDLFLHYLQDAKQASPKTIENYSLWLRRLVEYVGDIALDELTSLLVLDYRLALSKRDLSPRTVNYHMVALRSLLKFLHKHDIDCLAPEKIDLAKQAPLQVDYLRDEEIQALLQAPRMHETGELKKARDVLILSLLYST